MTLGLNDFANRQDATRYVKNSLEQPERYDRSASFANGTHIRWIHYPNWEKLAFSYTVDKPGQKSLTKDFQRRGERAFINYLADALVDAHKGL